LTVAPFAIKGQDAMELLRTWTVNVGRWCGNLLRGWDRFWFTPVDPATVGFVRILAASTLLFIHLACLPDFMDFVGPNAWVDSQAIQEIIALPDHPDFQQLKDTTEEDSFEIWRDKVKNRQLLVWYRLSIWFYVQEPVLMWILEGVFLVCMACYVIGFCSRPMAVICWFAHISFVTRGYSIWFGMDAILLFILFYLMFAPTGAALSVDRLLARWRALKKAGSPDALLEPPLSWGANAALRMIQIHMGVVYICSALAKLQGPAWWNGYATWTSLNTQEFALFPMDWLGRNEVLWQWVCGIGTLATILFELIFIFLIWLRGWRPLILVGAVLLHLGIGLTMGLFGFGVVMVTGCFAFLKPEEVRWFMQALFRGPTGYRYVYDRENKAQGRVARLMATFDVFRQVELVEMHEAKKASATPGTLVLPNSANVQGVPIFWKLASALRTLWLTWPIAYRLFKTELTVTATPPGASSEPKEAVPMKRAV
jgi:hypothetical protein